MGTLEYINSSYNNDNTSAVCESTMEAKVYTYESVWKEIEGNGITAQPLLSIENHKKQSGIISDIITIEMID